MAIKIKYRDPKTSEFAPDDIIINIKEGTLFYKDKQNLYKIQGDQIITPLVESNLSALRQVGDELTEVSASGFTTAGSVSASRFYASDGFYHSDDVAENTYINFPTGDKVDIVAGGINFIRTWQKDSDTDKLWFNVNQEHVNTQFYTNQNSPGLKISASGHVGVYGINKPSASLHVGGNVLTDSHITASGNISASGNIFADRYYGDDGYDNYLTFNQSSSLFKIQTKTYIKFDGSSAQREVTINEGTNDIDFVVKGASNNPLFKTDSANNRVGMHGVGTPTAGLHIADDLWVSGSNGHITASGNISSSGQIIGTINGGSF